MKTVKSNGKRTKYISLLKDIKDYNGLSTFYEQTIRDLHKI